MLGTERDEFNRQISILCAAYTVPLGDRADTCWRAFYKLEMVEFIRIIDFAISEDADFEKFPTVRQLWACRRRMRTVSGQGMPPGRNPALVEYALRNRKLSDKQRILSWHWIARKTLEPRRDDPGRCAFEFMGVIVPQDPVDPKTHPAIRVMFADCDWQPYVEDPQGRPLKAA